jgi:hypothetical protein
MLVTYSEAIENLRHFAAETGKPRLLALLGDHLSTQWTELAPAGAGPDPAAQHARERYIAPENAAREIGR